MGLSATTVDEQIQRLKSRGMQLDYPEEKIKEFLLDIGYYRLGFYWHPFEMDSKHNFKPGTKFSYAVKLYYLDSDLRHLLQKYLNRIEIHFRTQVIYHASNYYKTSPTWFADPNIMDGRFLTDLPKYYHAKFIMQNRAIKDHHSKYINDKYAPAWKTLEFLPFGSVLAIYRSLRGEEVQIKICKEYGIRNTKIFKEYMKNLLTIRNLCAHGGQLFDFHTPKGIPSFPGLKLSNAERHSLNGTFQLLFYFLDQISINRKKELVQSIRELLTESSKVNVIEDIIKNKMGYTNI